MVTSISVCKAHLIFLKITGFASCSIYSYLCVQTHVKTGVNSKLSQLHNSHAILNEINLLLDKIEWGLWTTKSKGVDTT